ncbi:hypothetical protein A3A84_00170 [Candidatus Collierbacteria bacterium RIFCSPLOWO2_01_FULL_50_23]|uniref:DUF2062 domain-containing protein n=2 Tax=Candidatus Collieribacteriota TaxID=1752725 RepID=A0A1F5EVF5_9BACT|nr:MAG: hypothetical protein A3D09_01110 [Candidatus Collierbacteria bacterium RIFCSPHIGHO2_02_FULL_49_10]OGD71439.1 MAG: hypothetical protein A2703_02970 [Candidatus Collierbacteria bacterium RIFCSPHIGHO2_01_FULL_50_25]OGD74517.1 MAG: hypothetical protein A3A84_00170 [Candidatus Collierbacteria bacterium RIFCSPLOWO2_01_FULL_50_23]
MRYQPKTIAKAASWTVGILYSVCTLVVVYVPDLAIGVVRSWYHTIDAALIQTSPVTLAGFVTGLVSAMLMFWVVGYLFAGFANYFSHK